MTIAPRDGHGPHHDQRRAVKLDGSAATISARGGSCQAPLTNVCQDWLRCPLQAGARTHGDLADVSARAGNASFRGGVRSSVLRPAMFTRAVDDRNQIDRVYRGPDRGETSWALQIRQCVDVLSSTRRSGRYPETTLGPAPGAAHRFATRMRALRMNDGTATRNLITARIVIAPPRPKSAD